jgi:deferrochelatase/peroxidase EfeB
MVDQEFLTKNKFSMMVEDTVRSKRLSYMDAIIHICEENEMELDDIRKFISQSIKDKVEAEAMKLNFLPKQNTLPLD